MNISATSGLITMKFYQNHNNYCGGGKTAQCFGPDRIRTLISMATDSYFYSAVFHLILLILAGNDDMHESSEEFELRCDSTTDCGVSCPLASEKTNPHRLIIGKRCCHFFPAVFDRILFILAGNNDIHKNLNEFKIRPDPIPDHRFTCP